MAKYTKKWLENRVKNMCDDLGLPYGEHYSRDDQGNLVIHHGNVALTKNGFGMWEIQKMSSNSTAVSIIYGAMTSQELAAYTGGVIDAVRILKV